MIAVHQALALIDANVPSLDAERLSLVDAVDRVLAEPAHALNDLPPFNQSAVDGYAVYHRDLLKPGQSLKLAGDAAAKAIHKQSLLKRGTALRILAGQALPKGADSIVPDELVEPQRKKVKILKLVGKSSHFLEKSDQMVAGTQLLPGGNRLTATHVSGLASTGITTLRVQRSPRIHVLIIGEHIATGGKNLRPGQNYDANGPFLLSSLKSWGYRQVRVQQLANNQRALQKTLKRAFSEADVVLSIGGSYTGREAYVPQVCEKLGAEALFSNVAQTPSTTLYFARHHQSEKRQVTLLGLPSKPSAVMINLQVYLRRILDRLENLASPAPNFMSGAVTQALRPHNKYDSWLPVFSSQDSEHRILLKPLLGPGNETNTALLSREQISGIAHLPSSPVELSAGSTLRWIAI